MSEYMWTRFYRSHTYVFLTLAVGVLSGCVSVLVDIDHLLLYFGIEGVGLAGRPLHTVFAGIASVFVVCSCTYLGRCVYKLVLKKKIDEK